MEMENGGDKIIPDLFSDRTPKQTAQLVDQAIEGDQKLRKQNVIAVGWAPEKHTLNVN